MFALADRERGVCVPSDERHTQETHGVHVVWRRRVRMRPVSSPAVYVISRAHLCSTRCCCCYCTEDTLLIHPTPSLTDHCMTSRHWDSTCCILMTSPGAPRPARTQSWALDPHKIVGGTRSMPKAPRASWGFLAHQEVTLIVACVD